MRTTVENHGCTGQGKHAMPTTTQRFIRPMPLLLLYHAPSFGCSSFFVYRGLCKNRSIDVRGHMQCLHVNLYGPQLLYSARNFRHVFFTRTVLPISPRNIARSFRITNPVNISFQASWIHYDATQECFSLLFVVRLLSKN